MAQLAMARTFMPQYAKLPGRVRKSVDAAIAKFAEHTHAGLHLEKIAGARDPRIRSIRVDDYWRGLVLAPAEGDVYCLLTVLGHDEAYQYARGRRFTVNQAIGVLQSHDEGKLDEIRPALEQMSERLDRRLFEHVPDKDLIRLGVDEAILPIVRLIPDEATLQVLEHLLPEPQYVALLALAAGMSPEEAWTEVAACMSTDQPPADVDPDDLVTAMRRSPDRVVFVDGPEELRHILAHPFDLWRVFLHPAQRRIALRNSYSGSFQVTGGAGTGKTVTALHRARHLATGNGARVLVTTFTTYLAETLQQQLELLVADEGVRDRIEVTNIDKVAYGIVAAHRGNPGIAGPQVVRRLLESAAEGLPYSAGFLAREWEHVILAQRITSEDAYLSCSRTGRGVALSRAQRRLVWQAIQRVVGGLSERGQSTFHQLADEAAALAARTAPRYDHVIVDEAQDLHPSQWRLLRALVAPGPDDLFIVGDPHQRIYDNRVSLSSLDINIRGRGARLKVNYRTTHEILAWAVPLLGLAPAIGLDDGTDTLHGYRSPMHGRRPVVRSFPDQNAELTALVSQVRAWLADGVEPGSIAVTGRSRHVIDPVREALKEAGIETGSLLSRAPRVRVGTMHGMKGLEFRCVAVVGVHEQAIPTQVTRQADDPVAHTHDLQRERCLLFVACTRARDDLYVSYTGTPSPFLASAAG
ncbi:UvrD-helicase domain-containing protein [Actinomadura miaoliensis]|uniref:DNA 3'-5' helicase n=1 Tax=Actinomadura miaoliensis TaxID=430685 RepID=A0ABP7W6Y5_9ACTN